MTMPLRLITVAQYTSPWEAHVTRGLLESEGIPAYLTNEHVVGANWQYSQALGGVKLQVPAQYAAPAREVLERCSAGEFEQALAEQVYVSAVVCRTCGGKENRAVRVWPSAFMSVLVFLSMGVILPPLQEKKCKECGGVALETP